MEIKRIYGNCALRKRIVPSDLLCSGNQLDRRDGQRRHMQYLADVARGLRTARVMVQKRAAAGEIQQRKARKNCQGALVSVLDSNSALHTPCHSVYQLRRSKISVGCNKDAS
jgi:hypothetical protein